MRPIHHPPGSQSTSTAAKPRSVVREGIAAGAVAATGVALLYLAADLLVGMPLLTQRLLGAGVAALLGLQLTVGTATGAVLQYTVPHYAGFMAFGVVAAKVVHLARRDATLIAGALLLFALAEASFFILVALLGGATHTGALMWPQLAVGNVVGTLLVGGWLWRRHPELRVAVSRGLGESI